MRELGRDLSSVDSGNWGKDKLADGKRSLTLSFNRLALS